MEAFLQHIETYFPVNFLSNEQISLEHPEWSVEKISSKTGINNRYIAAENETSSDMAFQAADKLLQKHNLREKIDYILFCTQSPDYFLPTSACILQEKLQLRKNIGALDFNLGCSGYIYGLGMAKGLIISGQAKNVLLITAETYSKFINKNDKSNRTIFGDAATASLINNETLADGMNAQIGNFDYGTDGSGSDYLIVKNGGQRNITNEENIQFDEEGNFLSNDNNLFMNGKEIFNFTANEIPPLVKTNLISNQTETENVDLFIFHQANAFMLNFIRNRCKIPKEKFYINIENIGNTVSNTIPIALKYAQEEGKIDKNKKIMLCGFGVGLSMGSVVLEIK